MSTTQPSDGSLNRKRNRWSAAEKLRIALSGTEPAVEVSNLCRRKGLNSTMYYGWKRTLIGTAERIDEKKGRKPSAREERLTKALDQAKEVIIEITGENLELKKFSEQSTMAKRRCRFSNK